MIVFLKKSPDLQKSQEKGHVALYWTNHRPKFTMKSHFWWDFLFVPFHLKSIPLKNSAKIEKLIFKNPDLWFFIQASWFFCHWPGWTSGRKFLTERLIPHLHASSLACHGSLDSPLVRHLLTSWWPAWQPSYFRSEYLHTHKHCHFVLSAAVIAIIDSQLRKGIDINLFWQIFGKCLLHQQPIKWGIGIFQVTCSRIAYRDKFNCLLSENE